MKLSVEGLQETELWQNKGYELPAFSIRDIRKNTAEKPVWLHFGAGNIFRSFIAPLQQSLLNAGKAECGIVAADTFDFDIIEKAYLPYENLSILLTYPSDGAVRKTVIGSVAEAVAVLSGELRQQGLERMKNIARSCSLQLVSFTITEKGYALTDLSGVLLPAIKKDMENVPERAEHIMGITAMLLWERYRAGAAPLALVSMDNCSSNGKKLRDAVTRIASAWRAAGFVDGGFVDYISDEAKVSFPWSMIDKITPGPSRESAELLDKDGVEGMEPFRTDRGTFIAPYVNAEPTQYLVIEDSFPGGRPCLEEAGVFFADRETVQKTERMKVTACLNPLHTALAVFGCLLGFHSIAEEMKDPCLRELVRTVGIKEGLPAAADPGILSAKRFVREVIEERLPNPYIPDTPQRIAADTSQKMAVRFGETIKWYAAQEDGGAAKLNAIPLVIAGWFRYLLAADDQGEKMPLSPDPMAALLQEKLRTAELFRPESGRGNLKELLANDRLFGIDLKAAGLSKKIEDYFEEMNAHKGAVRETLENHLKADGWYESESGENKAMKY